MAEPLDEDQVYKVLAEMGRRGGIARAKKLSAQRRKEIAIKASKAAARVRSKKAKEKTKQVKRRKPIAICTDCHAPVYDANRINGRCGRMLGRDTCRGVISSALNENDWEECTACSGSGFKGESTARCESCEGAGWLFVRR
jgi:hypothetical protein